MVLTPPQNAEELRNRLRVTPPQYFEGYWTWSFDAMGTRNQIIFAEKRYNGGQDLIDQLTDWLADFEARYSRFIPSSLISRLNAHAGKEALTIEPRDEELFSLCDWFYWRTQGLFDPTSGALLTHWDYHLQSPRMPSADALAETRQALGWSRVERAPGAIRLPHPGMRLDLGGIGKEYAVDKTAEILEGAGIADYMISFGRDIRCKGHPPSDNTWRIGLEHPAYPDQCWAGVGLNHGSIAASGQARRFITIEGEKFGHLVDPRTCKPAQSDVQASWAIAPTCTEAGVLASTALILGMPEGLTLMETASHCAGCLWSGTRIHQTRRFNRYVLEDHSPSH